MDARAHRMSYRWDIGVLLTLCLLPTTLWALDIPSLTDRVVDRAHILPPSTVASLNTALSEHESKTSNQVAILTLSSLEGQPLEEFSHQVATAWALGKKGTDNGALFLIVVKERKLRIEVGYGLEGTLTDAKSSRIIRHEVVPHFRAGDFPGGIVAGTQAILGTIEGTYTNTPQTNRSQGNASFFEILFLAVVLGTIVALFLGGRRIWSGAIMGSILSFIIAVPSALWLGLLAGGITSLLVGIFSNVQGPSSRDPLSRNTNLGSRGRSWPLGGPIGGPGGFGGGGFGGGFGGGGGGFGGGGASGGW